MRRGCYHLVAHKLLKEMMQLERRWHPSVLRLCGYSYQDSEDTTDPCCLPTMALAGMGRGC